MDPTGKEKNELLKRILFTLFILVIYLAGRSLLLTDIDIVASGGTDEDAQSLIMAMVTGGRSQYTVLALGIMPGMFASFIMQLVVGAINLFRKARFSQKKMQRATTVIMFIIAILMALSKVPDLVFVESSVSESWLRGIAFIELVLGAAVIYKLTETNQKHGIGGMSPIIIYNILSSVIPTMMKYTLADLKIPLLLAAGLIVLMLVMENVIIHIPVQRVSIHNIYADKDYLAFKINPVGVMPVMFAMTIFMVPQIIVNIIANCNPANAALQDLSANMTLANPVGIGVYMAIIILLALIFSLIMLNPGDIADNLQKGGDSIVGVYAGKKTASYLRVRILGLSLVSGVILAAALGGCLLLAANGVFASDLSMLPSMFMALVGLICNVARDIITYYRLDSYKFLF